MNKWNLREFKEGLKGEKGYRTPPDSCLSPQWHPRLVGNCLLCIYQFLTSNSNFKTAPNLQNSYFHKLNYLSPNIPKNHLNIYKTAQNIDMLDEHRDSWCLKRERDICVKTIITSQHTAFMWTPALKCYTATTSVLISEPDSCKRLIYLKNELGDPHFLLPIVISTIRCSLFRVY